MDGLQRKIPWSHGCFRCTPVLGHLQMGLRIGSTPKWLPRENDKTNFLTNRCMGHTIFRPIYLGKVFLKGSVRRRTGFFKTEKISGLFQKNGRFISKWALSSVWNRCFERLSGAKTDSPPRIIFAIHEIPRTFNTQQGSHHPLLPKESLIPAKICLTALNCSHFGGEVPKAFKIKERNVFYIIFLRHSCLERVEKHGHMHTKPSYRNKDILSHRVGLADRCFF